MMWGLGGPCGLRYRGRPTRHPIHHHQPAMSKRKDETGTGLILNILNIGSGPSRVLLISMALWKPGGGGELLQLETCLTQEDFKEVRSNDFLDVTFNAIRAFVKASDYVLCPFFREMLTREVVATSSVTLPLLGLRWYDPAKWSEGLYESDPGARSIYSVLFVTETRNPDFAFKAMDAEDIDYQQGESCLYAAKIPYMQKDIAKQCGFTWDPNRKSWVRCLVADETHLFPFECVPLEADEDY